MKTIKTITRELNLLDIADIEEALSAYLGQEISISDVGCTLRYFINDEYLPVEMTLDFEAYDVVDDFEDAFSYDVFKGEEGVHYWKGKRLAIDEPFLPVDLIFNFDVSAFKSFEIMTALD